VFGVPADDVAVTGVHAALSTVHDHGDWRFLEGATVVRADVEVVSGNSTSSGDAVSTRSAVGTSIPASGESVSAALAALVSPMAASDFVTRAIQMLEETGWVRAHRFLFEQLRQHLLGWPEFLAPAGIAVRMAKAVLPAQRSPQSTCIDSESPRA